MWGFAIASQRLSLLSPREKRIITKKDPFFIYQP
jgi:D-serine dehydratase